jgi:branched-chain amino acid transport system substrate-binding protein
MKAKNSVKALVLSLGLVGGVLSTADSAETLKIGVIAPLTGGGAVWGKACEQAAQITAGEINAKGGLDVGGKTYHLQIIAYDDQFKTADAVAAYNRLVNQDDVKYMIIHTSNAATALKQTVETDKVVAITGGFGGQVIDANSTYLFRFYSAPRDYMPALAAWMKANLKGKTIALVNPNIEGAYEQANLAADLYPKNGFEIVARDVYEMSEKDFSPLLTKVIARNPDIIDLGSSAPATAGLIVRQARELGYKGLIIKTAGPSPRDIVAAAGAPATEGMINFLFADPANPGYQRLAAEYKKNVGQDPNEMLLPCYDGFNALVRAIQKGGDVNDSAKVRDAFASVFPMTSTQGDTLTLGGKQTFGADQEIITTNYIGVIKDGQPVAIGKIK